MINKHSTNSTKKHSVAKPARLIFFADDKKGPEGPKSEKSKRVEPKGQWKMKADEMEKFEHVPYAKNIVRLYKMGRIKAEIFEELYQLAKNPNKTSKDEYKYFLTAIGKGRFPKRGEGSKRFLRALEHGTKNERARAKDILKNLSKDTALSMESHEEETYKNELDSIRAEDLENTPKKRTNSAALTTAEQGDVGSRIREITDFKSESWNEDAPSQEFLRELDAKEMVVVNMIYDANKLNKKVNDLKAKVDKEQKNKVPKIHAIRRLEKLIAETENQLKVLDKEIDRKREALHEDREKFRNYLRSSLGRYRAIKRLSQESGISIADATNLAMLFCKQKANSDYSLSIEGVEIDEKTGKAERKTIPVTIKRIYFERGKEAMEPGSAGELMIEYEIKGQQQETIQASYKNFLAMVNAFEAYEVIEDTAEFNQKYAHEIGYGDITQLEGQKFSAEILEETTPKKYRKEEITITSVKQTQKGWQVEIDHPALRKSRHELPNSMHASGYFDRHKQTFALGEFGAFLRQRNYQRVINSDEMQDVINHMTDHQIQESDIMLQGKPEALKKRFWSMAKRNHQSIKIPEIGQEEKVIIRDKDGRKKFAMMRREIDQNGEEYYTFRYNKDGADGNKYMNLPELPDSKVVGLAPGTAGWALNSDPAKVVTERKTGRHFLEDVQKGNIQEMANPMDESDDIDEQEELSPRHGSDDLGLENKPEKAEGKEKAYDTREVYEEVLPYDDVYKVGGVSKPEESYLMNLWNETRFFSVNDFWEMGKAMWEYYDNRFQRRQKEKYSSVGQELPFWAPEMRRINQSAENDQVNQFKESFDQKGIFEIQERLQSTSNRDEMKAALTVLCEKGQMRWDDISFWKNLNSLLFDKGKAIPIPTNGDPATRMSESDERTGLSFMKDAIDSLWGEGTYNDWFNQNKSTFSSNLKSFYEEGKEMEGIQGGHERRLSELLNIHKNGGYVDPHEYEGLIQHAIEAGKSDMQSKIYFIIEGIAYENSDGRTILGFDRMAHINSDQLMRFPILEYLCRPLPRRSADGKIKGHRPTIDDYKRWVRWFDEGNRMNCVPGPAVDKFMWKYVISSDETQNRINKDLRNGENLDHDDMFAYLPPATEQVVTDSCKATTGSKKFLTVEGYANVVPGFSQYMRSLSENKQRNKLVEAVKSYVRFEGIMTNKFEKARTQANDKYQRFDDYTMNSATIVSTDPPKAFIMQMNKMVRAIAREYDDADLNKLVDIIYNTEVGDVNDAAEARKQNTLNNAYYEFGRVFHKVVKSDAGEKMENVVNGSNLMGMVYLSSMQKDQRKTELAKQSAQTRAADVDYQNELTL